ncbi:MAG: hypothetical protein P8J87_09190, partial [Verrucomicrobiales bacterium]|nr:hypothetical protein [Verrucomicrobiales bacterium]
VESVQITISTTKIVRAYLEQLTAEGLNGKNVAETANVLITERIKELVRCKDLPPSSELNIDADS